MNLKYEPASEPRMASSSTTALSVRRRSILFGGLLSLYQSRPGLATLLTDIVAQRDLSGGHVGLLRRNGFYDSPISSLEWLVPGALALYPHRRRHRRSTPMHFRPWLVFKAHRWLYQSTLGSRVIKKKKKTLSAQVRSDCVLPTKAREAVPKGARI